VASHPCQFDLRKFKRNILTIGFSSECPLVAQSRHSKPPLLLSILSKLSVIVRMGISENIIVAKHWVDALDASSHGNYQRALSHLDYVDKSYKGKRIRYHLLRGFVCFTLKKYSAAVKNFETSLKLLKGSNSFNENERNYILGYASIFGNKALDAGNFTKNSNPFLQTDIAPINLSKVRQYLKINFPLRDYPNWDLKYNDSPLP
jgi:hypothetical protein